MLKWTVVNKRAVPSIDNNQNKSPQRRHSHMPLSNTAQRRHTTIKPKSSPFATSRRHSSHNLSQSDKCDKENQFLNSTPKSKDTISYIKFDSIVLRDVSNITPTNTPPHRRIICNKRCQSQPQEKNKNKIYNDKIPLTPPSRHTIFMDDDIQPTKKLCKSRRSLQPNFESPLTKNVLRTYAGKEFIRQIMTDTIEVKNSVIEKHLPGELENQNTYASTLPTFQIEYSPCPMRPTQSVLTINNKLNNIPSHKSVTDLCPSIKKSKIDNFNDFLTNIYSVASPEESIQFAKPFSMTPLANRLADLRFSRINDSLNSETFDKLPLDEMVNAILDNTVCDSTTKKQNDLNQTQEENYVNINKEMNEPEPYNEREVKTPENRLCSTISNMTLNSERKGIKRSIDETLVEEFTLKRQKCVRRKKYERETNNNGLVLNRIPSPNSDKKDINKNNSITKSSIHNLISIEQQLKRKPIIIPDEQLTPKSDLNIEELLRENLEQTPLSLFPGYRQSRQNILTLPEGIPSPGTPLSSLKKVRKLSPNLFSETFTIDPDRSQLFGLTIENGIPSPPCVLDKKEHDRSLELIDTPSSDPWTPCSDTTDDKRMRPRRCLSFDSPSSSLEKDLLVTPMVRRSKSKDNFSARGSISITINHRNDKILVHGK